MASQVFDFTGAEQTWTVPEGTTTVWVDATGASGDFLGGTASGRLDVTPGETLYIYVGESSWSFSYASSGYTFRRAFNGGGIAEANYHGGSGASDVRRGGNTLSDRVLVAGGAGGDGYAGDGGVGGGTAGADAAYSPSSGGTQTAGGDTAGGRNSTDGTFGLGGRGADSTQNSTAGGGGGGGWYGGAGGGASGTGLYAKGYGGGGGSSYLGGVSEGATVTGGSALGRGSDGQVVLTWNTPPHAPNLSTFTAGETIDRAATNRLSWTFADPDPGDTQSAYELETRPAGGPWSLLVAEATPNGFYDAPGGTFAAGDYEWRVRTADQAGAYGAWSAVGMFNAADRPGAPNITSPVNGESIPASETVVEWSTPGQDAYQVRVVDPADDTVASDTGVVAETATRAQLVSFPEQGVQWRLEVRVRDGGLWSPWSTVTVTASYTLPPAPVVYLNADDTAGTLTVTITNPAPGPDEPAVTHNDVAVDDGLGDGVQRKAANLAGQATWVYYTPVSGRDYTGHVQVTAYGDNTTSITTVA